MTSSEVSKQLASGLQAHHSADYCLASCLSNDGTVQAVTFAYLMYTDNFLVFDSLNARPPVFRLISQWNVTSVSMPLAHAVAKVIGYLLQKPGSRQVAILAVKHGTTVA